MESKVGGKLQLPADVTDPVVLKRFLNALVSNINSNPLTNGNTSGAGEFIINTLEATNSSLNFLAAVANVDELRNNIMAYISGNLETNILQNTKNVALIAEQFGTFYAQALAASWYGLSVKAGGAIAGLEIGSLDPDVTTPNDESSYFRVIADNFVVGRAFEDLSQEEKDYLEENNLPSFGTVYNKDKTPVPAILVTWNKVKKVYEIYFNGIVQFNNIKDEVTGDTLAAIMGKVQSSLVGLEETNDGVVHGFYQNNAPASGMSYGDWWVKTNVNPLQAYRYEGTGGKNVGTLSWKLNTDNPVGKAYIASATAEAAVDGKISTWYATIAPTINDANPTAAHNKDIWVNSSNSKQYVADAGTWKLVDMATAINTGTTEINGGKITTGSISADRLLAGTNATTVWTGGGLVSNNFNGNAYGNIGSPTNGFRLSSNAAGTSTDPNIYGAYIKGSTIEGITLQVSDVMVKSESYPNNFGRIFIDEVYVGTEFETIEFLFVSGIYSKGFHKNRMAKNNQEFLLEARLTNTYLYTTIGTTFQVSINNAAWKTIHDTVNMNTAVKYTHLSAAVDNIRFRVTFSFLGNSPGPITTFFKISTVNGL